MASKSAAYTANILSEIQISYHCHIPPKQRFKVTGSKSAEQIFRKIWQQELMEYQEQFYVLYLNRNNQVIGYHLHSIGGIHGTIVDIKQILALALKANASSILFHNHPSSSHKPSEADKEITRRIVEGANYLDLSVLDHLIITTSSYYSFADEGTLPDGKRKLGVFRY